MAIRLAINGFGRIGRAVVRNLSKDFELVAINDIMSTQMMAYLLQNDSVHGRFTKDVRYIDEQTLQIDGKEVHISHHSDPKDIDFFDAEVVIEATGKFLSYELAKSHLKSGRKVILSAPAIDDTPTFVYGINHTEYKGQNFISNASCTTNCLAPIVWLLEREFGIEKGLMTTIHSYTIDQNLLDSDHKREIRRSRAAAVNIIPTTTGAARAIFKVLPTLKGKLDGRSVRVPVADVSLMDLDIVLKKSVTKDAVNQLFKKAASQELAGVLHVDEEYRVSQDFLGSAYSSIVAADLTQVIDGNLVKIMSWYDNEWGYANRLLDMAKWITR
ncbi:glyceraldehyde 3-phosphate dehydrogenase [Nitratiruptor sp. YY08-26]|uniref:type I glyceraldehyde-3-phosphate dehydrogenase n=1 Tax=unclassified Nitratiruptor TaxID=2624044 RepID=UPI0019158AD4|nr:MULTISPECIES: type I glyceraldehyde-3-phosphate dehydrogenase [unclassified Nitratiruptor]BCD62774.1 glyceraldehyde 3-phosphate dehydrogenase [Nitratiruptor sp. YY08-13]BCD66710.1 glyceraldehyde 3-phosphate dehydrogenase [Nitratiruptor sp. YY08-26]